MSGTSKATKGRILFVEEDRETRDLVCTMLGFSGYEAVSASTISEATKFIKNGKFDLILLDWYFDDGTGIDLCKTIRSLDGDTPVFFYTGVDLEPKLQRARAAGAQGFLIKPLDFDKLLETVAEYALANNDGDGRG